MDIHEIVLKLVGEIRPVGDTYEDEDRFDNLKVMTELVSRLVSDIDEVASNKDSTQFSVSRAGKYADKCLTDLGITE